MKPIHPLRYGATNAADEAQDSARPEISQIPREPLTGVGATGNAPDTPKVSQLPHQTAKLPHKPSFYPEGETPAELIRTVATLLATLGIGNRNFLTFPTVDVIEMRAKLAQAYDALELTGRRYELTAQGAECLRRSVNDRGPLAKQRHEERARGDEYRRWAEGE